MEFPWERDIIKSIRSGSEIEIPDNMPLYEEAAFSAMVFVYRLYYNNMVTRDSAASQKQRIYRKYDDAKKQQEFSDRLAEFRARILKETEDAATKCRKDPTPENAIALCDAIHGITGGTVT